MIKKIVMTVNFTPSREDQEVVVRSEEALLGYIEGTIDSNAQFDHINLSVVSIGYEEEE